MELFKPRELRNHDKKTYFLHQIEIIGLIGIIVGTIFAAGSDVWVMIQNRDVSLADLLLMFIYLEVLAMVGHYFASGQLPIRFPLYIGMIALARYLILDMKTMDEWKIISVAVAILVLAISVLVIRFGHCAFPYKEKRVLFGQLTDSEPSSDELSKTDTKKGSFK